MSREIVAPFTLPEAIISLYQVDVNGAAITASPLYLGALAENFRAEQKFEKLTTWPTGRAYPKVHHVGESHQISIDRVWLTDQPYSPVNPNVDDFEYAPRREQTLCLVVAWQHEDDQRWVGRIYWEVTADGDGIGNQGIAEFMQSSSFTAQYFTRANGLGDVCPV